MTKGHSAKSSRKAGAADRDGMQDANRRHSHSYGEDLQRSRPPEAADARDAMDYAACPKDISQASARKLNFFQTLKAIFWGALGIRKGAGYTDDAARLNPVHVIVAGLIAAVLFVTTLVLLAKWAISALA